MSLILNLVPLALAVVLCFYVGRGVLAVCAKLFVQRSSRNSGVKASTWRSPESGDPVPFRFCGEFRHDRTDNTSWVFRDR